MTHDTDLIRRIDAMQATQVGPSDEWSKAAQSGYNQAATDIAMNILKLPAAPVSVQVKPLVWDDSLKGRWIGMPPTPLGNMAFWIFHDPSGFWRATTAPGKLYYPTLEAAQAAAQADYAARILAAIDVHPAPAVAQIRADAEARFADWFRKNYPGPDTIIHKPDWHAPKIFRAALAAMKGDAT